jgi:hypothetical protein
MLLNGAFLLLVSFAQTPAPQQSVSSLCSISFDRDRKRPTRVDNEAKACLDDVALNAQRNPGARLFLVGEEGADESSKMNSAAHRAINTKEYLVGEKGINASRVTALTGDSHSKIVLIYIVPPGVDFYEQVQGTKAVNEQLIKPPGSR